MEPATKGIFCGEHLVHAGEDVSIGKVCGVRPEDLIMRCKMLNSAGRPSILSRIQA